jgi:serine/threonine protein phosphatase PrpC
VRVLGEEPDTALVACVADGAGFSNTSEVGSELACQSIVASAAAHFEAGRSFAELTAEDILAWCEEAREKINTYAEYRERAFREYATTLCVAVLSAKGSLFFQIGDGAIVARRHSALGVVFWPESGEYANTTTFLTSNEFRERVQVFSTADSFSDVALMTDGIERLVLKFDSLTPHPPFFQPLFEALRSSSDLEELNEGLRQMLDSQSVRSKTDDDKTLVLASRISARAGEPG